MGHSKEKTALMEIVSTTQVLSDLKYTYIIGSMYNWCFGDNFLAWTVHVVVAFKYTNIIGLVYDW